MNSYFPTDSALDRFVVIIPVYNHERTVADVVKKTLVLNLPVIVVNDGSTDGSVRQLTDIPGVQFLHHRHNRGKGAALKTGMAAASGQAHWAITLDADGQHDPADLLALVRAIPEGERPIILGTRQGMLAAKAPWTSRFGREFSNFWIRVSGGPQVSDSQSGFRIYPLPECAELEIKSNRFQYEVEILVKAGTAGIPIMEAPVSVSYRTTFPRISHFHPFDDFLRNFGLFSRLIFNRVVGGLKGKTSGNQGQIIA